jgi:signal transduction histidine kinase
MIPQLNTAAVEIVDILHSGFMEKSIELSVHYAPDPPPVYAGRIEIRQVILNLLVNAVESLDGVSSEYRAIIIWTQIIDDTVLFEVRDSGSAAPSID